MDSVDLFPLPLGQLPSSHEQNAQSSTVPRQLTKPSEITTARIRQFSSPLENRYSYVHTSETIRRTTSKSLISSPVSLSDAEELNMKLQARLEYEAAQNKIMEEDNNEMRQKLSKLNELEQKLFAVEEQNRELEEIVNQERKAQKYWKASHYRTQAELGRMTEALKSMGVSIPSSLAYSTLSPGSVTDFKNIDANQSISISTHSEPSESLIDAILSASVKENADYMSSSITSNWPGSPLSGKSSQILSAIEKESSHIPNTTVPIPPASPLFDADHKNTSDQTLEVSSALSADNAKLEADAEASVSHMQKKSLRRVSSESLRKPPINVSAPPLRISSALYSTAKALSKSTGMLDEPKSRIDKSPSATASGRISHCIPHRFVPITGGLPLGKCAFCGHLFWNGHRGGCVKCIHCHDKCHDSCAAKMPPNCGMKDFDDLASLSKDEKKRRASKISNLGQSDADKSLFSGIAPTPVYGVALEPFGEVPYVVTSCIQAIERRGLNEEGIYRIPGRKAEVDKLRMHFNYGRPNLDEDEWRDVNAVAGALKLYFRELPEPLMTNSLYPAFLAAANKFRDPEALREALIPLVEALPPLNRKVLSILMSHLRKVASFGPTNKMYENNLAMVFGATLGADTDSTIGSGLGLCAVVESMIRENELIFPEKLGSSRSLNSATSNTNS